MLISTTTMSQTREVYLNACLGVSTFNTKVVLGPLFDIEFVDSKKPLTINFRNGYLIGTKHSEFMWSLSAGRRFDKKKGDYRYTDIGLLYGFTGSIPKTDFILPAGFYTTIHVVKNLSTRIEGVYNMNHWDNDGNRRFGVNISFNYKLRYMKKL